MRAVQRMKSFTSQVTVSAANQQQVGTDIANSTEQMAADIQTIKNACHEQSDWSLEIVQSVDNVRESAESNLESARIMGAGVDSLQQQIERLHSEIKRLQISQIEAHR
jgi:methyl-accepting chemotaxis protein